MTHKQELAYLEAELKEERKRREYDWEWYRWLLGLREEMPEDDIPF